MSMFKYPGAAHGPSLNRISLRLLLAAVSVWGSAACSSDVSVSDPDASFFRSTGPKQGTYYGAAARIGDGLGRTYVTVSDGTVEEIGLALTERALNGLPDGRGHSDGTHAHYNEVQLRMHPRNPTPIRFVAVNWNADGHEPEEIYGLPHFDFHFYTVTPDEIAAIDPSDPLWVQKANTLPAAEFVPVNYVSTHTFIPGATPADVTVPRMGLHWSDITSPELAGATFTETFIYGSWDGRMIFLEPMVTKAFLETRPDASRVLPRAQQGFNPGGYRVYWHQARREYRIALTDLPAQP